jgi:hypothetical protein
MIRLVRDKADFRWIFFKRVVGSICTAVGNVIPNQAALQVNTVLRFPDRLLAVWGGGLPTTLI